MISANVVCDALAPTESNFFISLLTLIKNIPKQASTLWNDPWFVEKMSQKRFTSLAFKSHTKKPQSSLGLIS